VSRLADYAALFHKEVGQAVSSSNMQWHVSVSAYILADHLNSQPNPHALLFLEILADSYG
jgi:hypothetical protein